jgi:hypothetical protein
MAGFNIQIKATDAAFLAQSLAHIPDKIPQAIASAFNKTIAKVKTSIKRGIVDATNLSSGRIEAGTYIRRATKSNLTAGVSFKGRQIGAINFKPKKVGRGRNSRGFKVAFMKGDKPIHFKRAFIATGKNGNEQMFEREKRSRLPLSVFYGPSLGTIYRKTPKIEQEANELANATIRQELESQVNRFLGRKKK